MLKAQFRVPAPAAGNLSHHAIPAATTLTPAAPRSHRAPSAACQATPPAAAERAVLSGCWPAASRGAAHGTVRRRRGVVVRARQHAHEEPSRGKADRPQQEGNQADDDDKDEEEAEVSQVDVERFERIAQALMARVADAPDEGDEDSLDSVAGGDGLLPFGASPDLVAEVQAKRHPKGGKQQQQQQQQQGDDDEEGFAVLRSRRRAKQLPDEALPKVAIVGRPNVGKSCLFNRIAGRNLAVVYDEPGVTRDRLYTRCEWTNTEFVLVDTGGLTSGVDQLPTEQQDKARRSTAVAALPAAIERQAAAGVAESDVVVLLVDGRDGVQPGDRDVLEWLRTHHPRKPVVMAVNKCDNAAKADMAASEFWELGLEPRPISAINGFGTGDMLDVLIKLLPLAKEVELQDAEPPLAVAIVGRPNVGKSSLLNAMCGEERVIVCDLSGTTRDAVDTVVTLPSGQKLTLIDTAGIRKRTKVSSSKDGAEQLSVDRALRAMRRAEVVVAVLDGSEGITQQDFRLTELAAGEGRAVVLVVNKWDKVDQRVWTQDKYEEDVQGQLRHVSWASVVCTTASKGRAVPEVIEAVLAAGEQHRRRVSTATLNLVVKEATAWKAPPSQRGSQRKGRIYYATQAGIQPPTFVFFVNDPVLIGDDYKRYMERALRDNIGLSGTPLKLLWRGKPKSERKAPAGAGAGAAAGAGAGGV